jgi:adenosine kinase
MNVIVTGSIAFDYLMSFPGRFSDHLLADKLDKISVSFLVDTLRRERGGCAANISYNLALLGQQPLMVGSVGCDFGEYGEALKKAGVDISGVRVFPEVYTASFFANTDDSGNQIASFYTGAMQYAKKIPLEPFLGPDALVLISPNDPEAMANYVESCSRAKTAFLYDPSQQIVRLDEKALIAGVEAAWIVIVNEYELEMLKKKTGWSEAEILQKSGILVVTLGENGSYIRTPESEHRIPAAKPKSVQDPTGVGDAYRAGLVKGLATGYSWDIAGRMGSLAAAYVLETQGPQSHAYTFKEFTARYEETFGVEKALHL